MKSVFAISAGRAVRGVAVLSLFLNIFPNFSCFQEAEIALVGVPNRDGGEWVLGVNNTANTNTTGTVFEINLATGADGTTIACDAERDEGSELNNLRCYEQAPGQEDFAVTIIEEHCECYDIEVAASDELWVANWVNCDQGTCTVMSSTKAQGDELWISAAVGPGLNHDQFRDTDNNLAVGAYNPDSFEFDVYNHAGGNSFLYNTTIGPTVGQGVMFGPTFGGSHQRVLEFSSDRIVWFFTQVFTGLSVQTLNDVDLTANATQSYSFGTGGQPSPFPGIDSDCRLEGQTATCMFMSQPDQQNQSRTEIWSADLENGVVSSNPCGSPTNLTTAFGGAFPAVRLFSGLEGATCGAFFVPESEGGGIRASCFGNGFSVQRDLGLTTATFAMDIDHEGLKQRGCISQSSLNFFDILAFSRLSFPQFGKGLGLSSQLALVNPNPDQSASAEVRIRRQNGQPLSFDRDGDNLTIPGTQIPGTLNIEIPPGGRQTFQTNADGAITVGSVVIDSNNSLSGVVLFGGEFGLAGVGSSLSSTEGITAPVEANASGLDTGIAVMSLSDEVVQLQFQLCDNDGNVLATATAAPLPPQGQTALFATQLSWDNPIDFSDFRGVLKMTANGRVAATALQQRPGQLASLPVAAQ